MVVHRDELDLSKAARNEGVYFMPDRGFQNRLGEKIGVLRLPVSGG